MNELENRYTRALIEWEEFKKEVIKQKNQKLLKLYPMDIVRDSDEAKKKRKRALQSVKMAQYRQYIFDRLSRGVGKGEKRSLKQVRKINEEGEII